MIPLALALASFVTVDGARLLLDGRPFAFVGANLDVMHGERARARAIETLEAARKDGLTVGRIWALGEGAADAGPWAREHELFRAGPEQFLDGAFAHLDRVIAEARARGLRLVVTLANYWGDYGGVPMYLRWAALPHEGFGARDRFFSDERARAMYRAHLQRVVERYADEPAILAWELINESHVDQDEAARLAWIREMAAVIRLYDKNHLITPGVFGYTTRRERAAWLNACKLPEVSYCDSHLYPQTSDGVESAAILDAFIDDRVYLAQVIAKKPLVLGEVGFFTDREPRWRGSPRHKWWDRLLARLFLDGAAGALAWIYGPWSGAPRDFGIDVDRPGQRDVRRVLGAFARKAREAPPSRNPRLANARGEAPLYDPHRVAQHPKQQRRVDDGLELPRFTVGKWERVGIHRDHAYGAGDGFFEYRFEGAVARLQLRLSSEWPGAAAPPDGGSRVRLSLDGKMVADLEVVPDDGIGSVHEIPLSAERGAHRLRLEVPPGPRANGLCVYGAIRVLTSPADRARAAAPPE